MSEFVLGTALSTAQGLRVRPDSAPEPLQKVCRLPVGVALQEGDRVLLLRTGGTFLVVSVYR